MTTDLDQNLEQPSSTSRTAKDADHPYTMIDNRVLQATGMRGDTARIHNWLLTFGPRWEFRSCLYLQIAEHLGKSQSTGSRIVRELREHNVLVRCYSSKERRNFFHVIEVPAAGWPRSEGGLRSRVVGTEKACYRRMLAAPGKERQVTLEVDEVDPAFLGRDRISSNLTNLQRNNGDVLHSSEHPKSPLSPSGGRGDQSICDSGSDGPGGPEPSRGAKRRRRGKASGKRKQKAKASRQSGAQGSRTPEPPVAESRKLCYNRDTIDASGFSANVELHEFFNDFPKSLISAKGELAAGTDLRYGVDLDSLSQNPLLAIAQRLFGYETWFANDIRKAGRFAAVAEDLAILGGALEVGWIHDRQGPLLGHKRSSSHPFDPDLLKNGTVDVRFLAIPVHDHRWEERVDNQRLRFYQAAKAPLVRLAGSLSLDASPWDLENLVASYDLGELAASMRVDRLFWAAVQASGHFDDDPLMRRAMQENVRPIRKEVLIRWLQPHTPPMPGGWHMSWVRKDLKCHSEHDATYRMLAAGIGKLLGQEKLPERLVALSRFYWIGYEQPA